MKQASLARTKVASQDHEARDYAGVKRFLNRLLGLPFSHQALLFNYFAHCYTAVVRSPAPAACAPRGVRTQRRFAKLTRARAGA